MRILCAANSQNRLSRDRGRGWASCNPLTLRMVWCVTGLQQAFMGAGESGMGFPEVRDGRGARSGFFMFPVKHGDKVRRIKLRNTPNTRKEEGKKALRGGVLISRGFAYSAGKGRRLYPRMTRKSAEWQKLATKTLRRDTAGPAPDTRRWMRRGGVALPCRRRALPMHSHLDRSETYPNGSA